ncbi:hypothetical protein ACFSVJ_06500 [Prauserella oleivorans]
MQAALVERRLARGERLTGLKMGLTSEAKMTQMGVDAPIWGRLTDAMHIPDGGSVSLAGRIHPRVEPELAFRIGRDASPGTPSPTWWTRSRPRWSSSTPATRASGSRCPTSSPTTPRPPATPSARGGRCPGTSPGWP